MVVTPRRYYKFNLSLIGRCAPRVGPVPRLFSIVSKASSWSRSQREEGKWTQWSFATQEDKELISTVPSDNLGIDDV